MDLDQRQQTDNSITRIFAAYGQDIGQVALELVANNGEILSIAGQKIQAIAPALVDNVRKTLDAAQGDQASYQKTQAELMVEGAAIIKQYQSQFKTELGLFASGYDVSGIFKMKNDMVAAGTAASSALNNAATAQTEATASTKAAMSKQPDLMDTTITRLENFKIQMNDLTIKYLPVTVQAIDAAFKVAELFAQSLNKLADVTKFILGDMTGAELARSLGLSESGTPPAPLTPQEQESINERQQRRRRQAGQPTVPYDPRYDPDNPAYIGPSATPVAPAPAAPPNPPGPVSQAPPPLVDPIATATMQSEIDRLNREVVALRNISTPVNEDQTEVLTAMLSVLEDSSDKLTRINDALA